MMAVCHPRRSNCLFWAICMKRRYGGYISWRKSKVYWGPHFMWSSNKKDWFEYVPIDSTTRWYEWLIPQIMFRGKIREVK